MAAQPGALWPLTLEFYNETSGALTDPTGVIQLDITYGDAVGIVPDYAGPFYYTGSSSPSTTQIYRISTGVYQLLWQVPINAPAGVYIANWSVGYSGSTFLVVEDFTIAGGFTPPVGSADTGFWTGSLTYEAPYADLAIQLGATDGNGVTWLIKKVEGWDSPPVAGSVLQRSGDHGGWPMQQYYAARIITLHLLASAPTQALRDLARAQLQQVIPPGDLATFTLNEPVPKLAYVRRNAATSITEVYPTLSDVEFTIPLVAPDPRRYAAQQQTAALNAAVTATGVTIPAVVPFTLAAQAPAGSVTAMNGGTFETRPIITVTGPIAGPAVANLTTGQTVSFSSLTLGSGDVLTVDLQARQGALNGVFRPADIASAWWTMWPGGNLIQLQGTSTGGASMSVTWNDAYI